MFGIDFSEIVVVMVVALIVVGPERLPKVARTMGQWAGNLQRYINRIKMDVNNSMELDELRDLERKIKAEKDALEESVHQAESDLNHGMHKLETELQDPSRTTPPSEPSSPIK